MCNFAEPGKASTANMAGPYMRLEFVDLPLETAESAQVDITCVEAQGNHPQD